MTRIAKSVPKFIHGKVRLAICILFLLWPGMVVLAQAQAHPDFSGIWKQDNERSQPKRKSDATLRLEHHDPVLTVETTIERGAQGSRHALQKYTTGGKVSISTGADGDEFHTSIVWKDESLVFSIEEHEDGRILLSRETWTLLENGAVLERVREPLDTPAVGTRKQTLIYLRQSPQS
jgi:hypothetical protein